MYRFKTHNQVVGVSQHINKNTALVGNLKRVIFFLFLITTQFSMAQHGGPSPVRVAKVEQRMMAPIRKIPAIVQAKVIASIKAESRGVVNRLVEIGTLVKKGETLAELTDTQSKLRSQELQDAVKSSKARYNFLKAEKARLQDLVEKNLISKTELEQNNSDFLSAKSELAQAQSRLKQYQDQITKLTIVAPFNGHVMQQFTQVGALLNSGDNVVELMQTDNLEVVIFVPIKYKNQLKINAVWKIQTEQTGELEAKISKFTPAAVGNSHTIEVHLITAATNLWAGESVNVLVPTKQSREVVAVPRDALVIRRSGVFVYVVKENKAHKVDVTTGVAQGNFIEVNGQLSLSDTVITRGNERIRPQAEVTVIN